MQHGYGGGGGVSEFQQFMVDASSLFSISSSAATAGPQTGQSLSGAGSHLSQAVPQSSLHHPHFAHFHHAPIPFTQQLFQQHHAQTHHHFQLFNNNNHNVSQSQHEQHDRARLLVHQQLGLDPESGPENSGGTGGGGTGPSQSFLSAAMGFKLAVDGGTGTGGADDDDVMMSGGTGGGGEEESAIKEPSWRPLDIDYISSNNNNKRCKDKEQETAPSSPQPPPSKYFKKSPEQNNNNYKLFSELEAIYKPGSSTGFTDCTNTNNGVNTGNQTGSGSALTGDENPVIAEPIEVGDISMDPTETSAGEEATPARKASKSGGEGRRKRRRQRRLSSLASFFERLVRQLVDHQEALHNRFLESMERREKERANREEAWRLQEAAKAAREAAVRAQERALATAREAAIVSFLEKITGETINLPSSVDIPVSVDGNNNNDLQLVNVDMSENMNHDNSASFGQFNSSRWPKTEVQALIRVRSGLESRFQEPGLKGPLWEEVSMRMTGLGYKRSSKRCKEKWENINKYFRKAKESGKKRPQHSKTCPYFHQLDQLYSKSSNNNNNINNCMIYSPGSEREGGEVVKGGSELLDAVVVPLDQNQMGCDKFEERESEEDEEDEREEEREGEGESNGQEMVQNRRIDSGLFF